MLTRAQRKKRATMFKAGAFAALAAVVFLPKMDSFELPSLGFPLISTVNAAE
ncbi:hypothetical protein SAMN05216456_0047 [Devosia crocina]|uniref:Uncharacterized protein n=1 Tax=Devosia crocina TaxID=429728 RepID=A0A1I7MW09_9HYPH|nr:hypothetical protein [Devosia crocina]SFV26575.1 hypothetical protein SAMN05216456_0047 [Devosia crocina]